MDYITDLKEEKMRKNIKNRIQTPYDVTDVMEIN